MYSASDVTKLVNAQSKADRNEEKEKPEPKNPLNLVPLLCLNDVNKLVNAQSSKQTEETPVSKRINEKTWSLSEVFALQNGCYDPRNFGKVTPFRKKAKVEEKEFDVEDEYAESA